MFHAINSYCVIPRFSLVLEFCYSYILQTPMRLLAPRPALVWRGRGCCTAPPVRVRFAPSPTGHLHLGGLRTALYNWLFARARGGAFILRVEDTDQGRLVPGAAGAVEEVLAWAGMPPDESPLAGGAHGPYSQSQRLELYREQVEQLLATGHAYRCFCSTKRLELLKREASRCRQPNKYDRRCLGLAKEEVAARVAAGEASTVRFLLTPHPEPWRDLVYGQVSHDVFLAEGDPVILKSDGFPTYHLASVVDDHLMEVSHVLRGVEWQASTPKHLLLYRAFGWRPPHFAHLPLIVNSDGTKLSKRQGDLHIRALAEQGFSPEAVINFVTLVGGGFEDREYSLEVCHALPALAAKFQLEKVHTTPGRLELPRLDTLNRAALQARVKGEGRGDVVERLVALVREAVGAGDLRAEEVDVEQVERYLDWAVMDRVCRVEEMVGEELMFLWALPRHTAPVTLSKAAVTKVMAALEVGATDKATMKSLKLISSSEGVRFPELMADLRVLLTGRREGPPVLEVLDILGLRTALARLGAFLDS